MGRRLNRKRERRQHRRSLARVAQRIRELFSTAPPAEPDEDISGELEGGLGVREPRRPLNPTLSGAVALELPPGETRDVWAVGEDAG
jgi:hypothetical protein